MPSVMVDIGTVYSVTCLLRQVVKFNAQICGFLYVLDAGLSQEIREARKINHIYASPYINVRHRWKIFGMGFVMKTWSQIGVTSWKIMSKV